MKKAIAAILIVILVIGAWLLIRTSSYTEPQSAKDTNKPDSNGEVSSVKKGTDWPKSSDLNQKITAKNVVHEIGQPNEPVKADPEPEVRDERIGKENPSMIEHPKAEDLPPLDMMSTEEQIKFNKEIIMTPEQYEAAKKKISEAEIHPDVTEQQRLLDIEVEEAKAKAKAAAQQGKK